MDDLVRTEAPSEPRLVSASAPKLSPVAMSVVMIGVMVGIALLMGAAVGYAYVTAQASPWLQKECQIGATVGAIGIAICLGGVMHYVDRVIKQIDAAWYVRWPLELGKRVLLVVQMWATVCAMCWLGWMFLVFKMPWWLVPKI